jgi:hypothetical protein
MWKQVMNLDNYEKDALHRSIFRFYEKGNFPVQRNLHLNWEKKMNYSCSVSLIYKTLKITTFKYRKSNNGSKFVMERGGIVAARIKFQRPVHNLTI